MAQASLARTCMTYQPFCWGGKVGLGERFRGNHQDFTGVWSNFCCVQNKVLVCTHSTIHSKGSRGLEPKSQMMISTDVWNRQWAPGCSKEAIVVAEVCCSHKPMMNCWTVCVGIGYSQHLMWFCLTTVLVILVALTKWEFRKAGLYLKLDADVKMCNLLVLHQYMHMFEGLLTSELHFGEKKQIW